MTSIKILLFGMTLFLSACNFSSENKDKKSVEHPNILLIVADDLGYNDLSCYGNKFIETPHLDRLAEEGIRFTDGYAAAPLCSPTRASIQTGLYPARIGMTEHIRGHPKAQPWMKIVPVKSVQGLDTAYLSLPELMKKSGYTTGHIGKWHLGGGASLPLPTGYDFNFAGNWAGLPRSFFYPFFDKGVNQDIQDFAKEGDYLTDVLTTRAISYMEEKKDSSFFLQLAFYSPHVPIEGKENWVNYYHDKRSPQADSLLPNVHYAAMVAAIDENIGRIMDALDSLQLSENTLVVFTSDNGGLSVREVPGYDKHTPPTDNGPLKEGKGYLSEGGIKEPFIFRWKEHISGGKTNNTPVITTDFFNTFASLTGVPDRTADGLNLTPIFYNEPIPDRNLFWHHPHYSPQRGYPSAAIRSGYHKLIYYFEDDRSELYNLKNDPSEEKDLFEDKPELGAEMVAKLEAWQREVGAVMPERNKDFTQKND